MATGLHLAVQVTGVSEVLFESGPSFEDAVGQRTLAAEAETSIAGVEAPKAAEPQVLGSELLAAALDRQRAAAPRCSKPRENLAGGASHDERASGCLLFLVVSGGAGEDVAEAAAQEGTVDSWSTAEALLALLRGNLAQGSSASPTGAARVTARS